MSARGVSLWCYGCRSDSARRVPQPRHRRIIRRIRRIIRARYHPAGCRRTGSSRITLPADGAADTGNLVTLEWEASAGAASYDVYFGTDSPPAALAADGEGITATELAVSGLSYDTTYSWFVRAKNAEGSADSAVRSFSTGAAPTSPPGQASDPTPADGAVGVAPDSILQWTAADGAESYNIYLGTGSLPGSATATGITATSYDPSGDLTLDAEYYWRVDAVNAVGHHDRDNRVDPYRGGRRLTRAGGADHPVCDRISRGLGERCAHMER